jgi:predicted DCC family thiol-disulfide oxidoreductase YuxK
MNQFPVIIFDGICNLCCGWVQYLIRRDKTMKFRFVSIQSETGQKLLKQVQGKDKMTESIIYLKGDKCFRESSAVLEILTDLGGAWKLIAVLKLIPKPIRNKFYQLIAKKRYRYFGKRTTCLLPTPVNKKRFLT